jgi:hypothetical protein
MIEENEGRKREVRRNEEKMEKSEEQKKKQTKV